MCLFCNLAASEAGAETASRCAAISGTEPDLRRAAPVNLEVVYGAAAAAMPEGVGVQGRRTLIKGGTILSMDDRVGNHAVGDVLIDGSKIAEVAARIDAPDAVVIDASGHIVMPGFIDAHSHQFETALRSFLAELQRMFANELALQGKDYPKLMSVWDALRLATIGGAKGLKIDSKTGSLTPGKDADIILLDATALNVTPLNHAPGAVVTLMERSNVSTVMCAGQIKTWRGAMSAMTSQSFGLNWRQAATMFSRRRELSGTCFGREVGRAAAVPAIV